MKTLFVSLMVMLAATLASAQDGYNVRAGDTLAIEVLEDPSLNRQVLVTPGGSFSFPFAGTVSASGKSTDQISANITSSIQGNFASTPNVFVSVQSVAPRAASSSRGPATIDVYLLGQVNSPGTQKFERGTTFLQALAESGGFTRFAATKRVQLRRRNSQTGEGSVVEINFRALQKGGTFNDFQLADGDVILVPERRLFE